MNDENNKNVELFTNFIKHDNLLHTSLSTSFRGYLTCGSTSVTGDFFFFLPNKNILARTAVTTTTPTPTAIGRAWKQTNQYLKKYSLYKQEVVNII